MTIDKQPCLGIARVEVLGRTDYMESKQLSTIKELPQYLLAEEVDADIFFREPGGMGIAPLETIELFLAPCVSSLLYDLAKASIKALIEWSKKRIQQQPPENEPPEGRPVHVTLYGPKGELLKIIEVTRDDVNSLFTHPSIEDR